MALPTTERLFWHMELTLPSHKSASGRRFRRFLITKICRFLWHVVNAPTQTMPARSAHGRSRHSVTAAQIAARASGTGQGLECAGRSMSHARACAHAARCACTRACACSEVRACVRILREYVAELLQRWRRWRRGCIQQENTPQRGEYITRWLAGQWQRWRWRFRQREHITSEPPCEFS